MRTDPQHEEVRRLSHERGEDAIARRENAPYSVACSACGKLRCDFPVDEWLHCADGRLLCHRCRPSWTFCGFAIQHRQHPGNPMRASDEITGVVPLRVIRAGNGRPLPVETEAERHAALEESRRLRGDMLSMHGPSTRRSSRRQPMA